MIKRVQLTSAEYLFNGEIQRVRNIVGFLTNGIQCHFWAQTLIQEEPYKLRVWLQIRSPISGTGNEYVYEEQEQAGCLHHHRRLELAKTAIYWCYTG